MDIITRDYGRISVDEDSVIRFDEGILGFEEYHDYVLLDDSSGESPFKCLQSLEESDLAFILLDPFIIKPDYEITLGDELIAAMEIHGAEDVVILAVVVVPDDITQISFNLKAPVVINARIRKGVQYVLDNDRYKVRHYIMEEMKNTQRQNADAGQPDDKQTTKEPADEEHAGTGQTNEAQSDAKQEAAAETEQPKTAAAIAQSDAEQTSAGQIEQTPPQTVQKA